MFMHTILFLSQMVNAVYGKTIENLSDRDFVKICRTAEELMHAVSKKHTRDKSLSMKKWL